MTQDDPTGTRRVRVALIGCTGILGEIIGRTVAAQPEIEVLGEFLPGEPGAADADLVVWNEAGEGEVASWLLEVRRTPRVVATVGDGRDASLWELTPHRTRLGELSPSALADAIASQATGETA